MSVVHLSQTKRLRFPARTEDFTHGVEIGVVAVLMDMPLREFTRKLSTANLDQVRALAAKMNYQIDERPIDSDWSEVTFRIAPALPKLASERRLRLVHSA